MLQAAIDETQAFVNGVVRMKLYKGNAIVAGRKSEQSLFDESIATFEDDADAPVGIGHFFGALRIDGFRDVAAFKATMDDWITTFRKSAPIDPSRPVRVPGDPEWAAFDERSKNGVPVKLAVLADLRDIAERVGVAPPFDVSEVDLSSVKRVIVAST